MADGLVVRRSGFDISDLADYKSYHLHYSYKVPESIDMTDVKAYMVYFSNSTRGAIAIYTNTGECVLNSYSDNYIKFSDTMDVNFETRTLTPSITSADITIVY